MTTRFIHSADWQLGKPFAGIDDVTKRTLVQKERRQVIQRLGAVAREHGAEFMLVAGDLFDSASVDKATVADACSAIGALGFPVIAIPGNHDHAGPGSIWQQPFFQRERASLAPNLRVLTAREPVELDSAVVFPCPLLRRAESDDPTAWLRGIDLPSDAFGGKPRIVLAHGTTQGFGSGADEGDDDAATTANLINLPKLADDVFDYIALGDWHGAKQVGAKAWYSGTPELDRFPKGESNDPGHCLAVAATRGSAPVVQKHRTARFGWYQFAFDFTDDAALDRLRQEVESRAGNRSHEDLLRLELSGSLGIGAASRLEEYLDSLEARLLRVQVAKNHRMAPTDAEITALTQRVSDPLIASVAKKLVERLNSPGLAEEDAAVTRVALRELHAACNDSGGKTTP